MNFVVKFNFIIVTSIIQRVYLIISLGCSYKNIIEH